MNFIVIYNLKYICNIETGKEIFCFYLKIIFDFFLCRTNGLISPLIYNKTSHRKIFSNVYKTKSLLEHQELFSDNELNSIHTYDGESLGLLDNGYLHNNKFYHINSSRSSSQEQNYDNKINSHSIIGKF